jgi:uroporphyrinogen-III synthase
VKLVIIRPQPGADATAKRAAALGMATVVTPVFAVRPVDWSCPEARNYDALMITSANVLIHGGIALNGLQDLPVLAVGTTTAARAKACGFTVAATGKTGAAGLWELAQAKGYGKLLWLTGEDHSAIHPPKPLHVDTVVVYKAHALLPSQTLVTTLNTPAVIALHSPRAAITFRQICNDLGIDKAGQSIVALSRGIANAAGTGWHAVAVAERPNDAALLSMALSFFTNQVSNP